MSEGQAAGPDNQVLLRGRVNSLPTARSLPSGAEIVSFRLVMARTSTVMTRGSRQRSDWVDCSAWSSGLRRRVAGWKVGDVVEVRGALRRRHYRAGELSGSRVEIEVLEGRLVQRAPLPPVMVRQRASPESD